MNFYCDGFYITTSLWFNCQICSLLQRKRSISGKPAEAKTKKYELNTVTVIVFSVG